jgi:hypothetical protein
VEEKYFRPNREESGLFLDQRAVTQVTGNMQ